MATVVKRRRTQMQPIPRCQGRKVHPRWCPKGLLRPWCQRWAWRQGTGVPPGESRGRLEGRWQRGLTLLKAWAQAGTLLATNRRWVAKASCKYEEEPGNHPQSSGFQKLPRQGQGSFGQWEELVQSLQGMEGHLWCYQKHKAALSRDARLAVGPERDLKGWPDDRKPHRLRAAQRGRRGRGKPREGGRSLAAFWLGDGSFWPENNPSAGTG